MDNLRVFFDGDLRFLAQNDALQHLGNVGFRAPVPAYKHSAAQFLHLLGELSSDAIHPRAPTRPQSDRILLLDCALRLGLVEDAERVRRELPGRPDVCNIYSLHKIFSGAEASNTVYSECTTAQRGCVDCKRQLADSINDYLKDLRERREDFKARPGYVQEILLEGGKKARAIAAETIAEVYEKMGLG